LFLALNYKQNVFLLQPSNAQQNYIPIYQTNVFSGRLNVACIAFDIPAHKAGFFVYNQWKKN
jgi:hypothetical protein